LKLTT